MTKILEKNHLYKISGLSGHKYFRSLVRPGLWSITTTVISSHLCWNVPRQAVLCSFCFVWFVLLAFLLFFYFISFVCFFFLFFFIYFFFEGDVRIMKWWSFIILRSHLFPKRIVLSKPYKMHLFLVTWLYSIFLVAIRNGREGSKSVC